MKKWPIGTERRCALPLLQHSGSQRKQALFFPVSQGGLVPGLVDVGMAGRRVGWQRCAVLVQSLCTVALGRGGQSCCSCSSQPSGIRCIAVSAQLLCIDRLQFPLLRYALVIPVPSDPLL